LNKAWLSQIQMIKVNTRKNILKVENYEPTNNRQSEKALSHQASDFINNLEFLQNQQTPNVNNLINSI